MSMFTQLKKFLYWSDREKNGYYQFYTGDNNFGALIFWNASLNDWKHPLILKITVGQWEYRGGGGKGPRYKLDLTFDRGRVARVFGGRGLFWKRSERISEAGKATRRGHRHTDPSAVTIYRPPAVFRWTVTSLNDSVISRHRCIITLV